MKMMLLIALLFLAGCFADTEKECDAGAMRCSGNITQMCNADEQWENLQDCGVYSETCSTTPSDCSGYYGIACCF